MYYISMIYDWIHVYLKHENVSALTSIEAGIKEAKQMHDFENVKCIVHFCMYEYSFNVICILFCGTWRRINHLKKV